MVQQVHQRSGLILKALVFPRVIAMHVGVAHGVPSESSRLNGRRTVRAAAMRIRVATEDFPLLGERRRVRRELVLRTLDRYGRRVRRAVGARRGQGARLELRR